MLTPFVERPSTLTAKQHGTVLDGVSVADAPLLAGYVETEGRPTADIILESISGTRCWPVALWLGLRRRLHNATRRRVVKRAGTLAGLCAARLQLGAGALSDVGR